MSKLGQLALLQTRDHWKRYKEELAIELAKQKASTSVALEFPSDPKKYPCLVAATLPPGDPTQEGAVLFPRVLCCYVYPDDAQRLIDVAKKAETVCQPVVELIPDDEPADEPTPENEISEPAKSVKYKPSQVGTLVLALVTELHAIGALKKENLIKAVLRVEKWLATNYSHNADKSLVSIIEKLWDDQDAG